MVKTIKRHLVASMAVACAFGCAFATEQYTVSSGGYYIEFTEDIGSLVVYSDFGSVGGGGCVGWLDVTGMESLDEANKAAKAIYAAEGKNAAVWKDKGYFLLTGIAEGTRIAFYEIKNGGQGFLGIGKFTTSTAENTLKFSKKSGGGGGDEKMPFTIEYVSVSPTPIEPGTTPESREITQQEFEQLPSEEQSGNGGEISGKITGQPLPGALAVLLLAGGAGMFARSRRRKSK